MGKVRFWMSMALYLSAAIDMVLAESKPERELPHLSWAIIALLVAAQIRERRGD
jgi:hypothetical protein